MSKVGSLGCVCGIDVNVEGLVNRENQTFWGAALSCGAWGWRKQ